ncbi:hypothetical protein [Amycolatopsis sp. NPDC052450]|uniref:hypothetical protein n=1 Tax=Amycolatopsis sp. NPDC052450 TaxID=3363937 RepID=UPI0037C67B7F
MTYGVLALVHLYLAVETRATWSAVLAVAYLCVAAGCVKSAGDLRAADNFLAQGGQPRHYPQDRTSPFS